MRLTQTVVRSFDRDIGALIARLERHARAADQTAVATELLRAATFRKEADQRHHEELIIQCERWLKPSDIKRVHLHQVRVRLDGTCDWITSNNLFERWIKPGCLITQDRLLVISGTHGCGKSVLASSIVARLEEGEQHTLFFAFSTSDGSRQSSESLIRTLLWQLLHQTSKKESVDAVHRLRINGQPTISELWEAFGCIASSLAKPVYCVIDGIDECIDYDHAMSIKVMQILEVCPNLRILLLGRPHVTQEQPGGSCSTAIKITSAMLTQDIEAFINDEIAKSDFLSLPEFRETVYKILKGKSDGMFLWVRLMVDDLKKSSSKSEFSERLQNLPRGLEKAYQLLFLHLSQKLDKFELRLAQNVLAFTIASCRPLTFDEFRYVHALHCRSLETVAQPLKEYLLLQPFRRVLGITEGLISMTDGVLRLIHSSVRDFLIRPEDRWVCDLDKAVLGFKIDITQTHRSFAWLCLDYLRLETDVGETFEISTSQSTQVLRDSCPLLGYATSYAVYHLNRSGPLCSITLAKMDSVIQSTYWVEHFAHLLFEDTSLYLQLNEFDDFAKRMADAGLDKRFLAIFEETLKRRTDQIRKAGNYNDPLTEYLEMHLNEATDGQFGTSAQKQSNDAESSMASQHLQTRISSSKRSSNDSSATVSRIMDLLKGQASLTVAHQIELCLRLSTSLRNTHVLIDPLKTLFRLILRKASGIPVFALMLIGDFYWKLEKFQEALEVYTAASKNLNHLNVPLKSLIHSNMGYCYEKLGLYTEALRSHEKAYSGREILLGRMHHETLESLIMMIRMNGQMRQYTEVLRLSDQICKEHEFVPELNLVGNLILQCWRYLAYRHMGDEDKKVQLKETLRETLKICRESCRNDNDMGRDLLLFGGHAYYILGEYDTALESFQSSLKAIKNSKGSDSINISTTEAWIARTYKALERYHEAKELFETVLEKRQRVLGPDHPMTRETKSVLDTLTFDDDEFDDDDFDDDDFDNDNEDRSMITEVHAQSPCRRDFGVTISDDNSLEE